MNKCIICNFAVFLIFGCGKSEGLSGSSTDSCSLLGEAIIGENHWIPVEKEASKAPFLKSVSLLEIPSNSTRCTGLLISHNLIMTNNHCIPNALSAKGVIATFGYTEESPRYDQYFCGELVATSFLLDFSVIKCEKSPGESYPLARLGSYAASVGQSIYIGQQNCDYNIGPGCDPFQKIAHGKVKKSSKYIIAHDVDTLPGSSGAPIFDELSDRVIALHNSGIDFGKDAPINFGIPMGTIINQLEQDLPDLKLNYSATQTATIQNCAVD